MVKENKDKKDFKIGYNAVPYKDSKHNYMYMGTFVKSIKIQKASVIFKCEIFRNTSDTNILVLFKWGSRHNLTEDTYKTVLDNMFIFIVKTIYSDYNNSNILLFGFSMGANIAQHIALRFIDNEDILKNMKDNEEILKNMKANAKLMKNNIYIVSLGAGGTMTSKTFDTFNDNFTGKFLSISIAGGFRDSPMANDDKLAEAKKINYNLALDKKDRKSILQGYYGIDQKINTNILRDKAANAANADAETRTVKSLIINMDNYFDTDYKPKYKLGRLYDYSGLNNVSFNNVSRFVHGNPNISHNHNYKIYRTCIEMLVSGSPSAYIL
jgi:hypothetical protein